MDRFALLDRLDGAGDAVLSPYGVERALDVARRGARGEARAVLDTVLGPDEIAAVADRLVLAQAAWLAAGYAPGPALMLDTGPLDPDAVNAWAREKTDAMIPAIVDSFSRDDKLAITDAIYLDARWRLQFTRIGKRPFEGAGEVEMMSVDGTFEHAEGAVRLPYRDGGLRFVAMQDESREPEWKSGRGTVVMPAFSTESRHELAPALAALGLGPAFAPSGDFEDLFTGPAVMARAAAAFTGPTFDLTFDRPFTWAVEHAPSGTPLFVGRVRHPRERST